MIVLILFINYYSSSFVLYAHNGCFISCMVYILWCISLWVFLLVQYQLTRIVPEKIHRAVKCVWVCVHVSLYSMRALWYWIHGASKRSLSLQSWEIAEVISPCLPRGLWLHIVIIVFLLLCTVCPRHPPYPVLPLVHSRGHSPICNLGTRMVTVVPQLSANLSHQQTPPVKR